MSENRVKVRILENTYTIQGEAAPEYILKLSEYVNEKMEEVRHGLSNSNPLQTAILAALNIADEYFQMKEMKAHLTSDLETKANALISMLDEGLIGDIYSRADLADEVRPRP